MVKKWNSDIPKLILGFSIVLYVFTYMIQNSIFSGKFVGEINGKVESVYTKRFGGYRGMTSMKMAKVELVTGEQVNIICELQCKSGNKIKVKSYDPIFSNKLVYIYK